MTADNYAADEILGYFLADLLHLADRHEVPYPEILRRGMMHYIEEARDAYEEAAITDAVDRVIQEAQAASTLDTDLGKLLGSPAQDDAEPDEESL